MAARLRLFSETGVAHEQEVALARWAAYRSDPAQVVPTLVTRAGARSHDLFYWVESDRPDVAAYSVTRHRSTGYCSGDHSF